uniref:Uncharacterized protein n=1 Tax=Anguilla anguilla TaxID=7936 RepID=A0A0E9XM09_ANGAN
MHTFIFPYYEVLSQQHKIIPINKMTRSSEMLLSPC